MIEAEASYARAIVLKPNFAEAHYNLGITLQEMGKLEKAKASYEQAITLKTEYAEAHYRLGGTLKELGKLAEAEASYSQALALNPDFISGRNELLTCLYLLDKKTQFLEQLDYLISQDKASSVIGSLICRSALKYGIEKPNIFCNEPLKYVHLVDLKTKYNFEEIFVQNTQIMLVAENMSNRRQSLLSNGLQTYGNLFDKESKFTSEIQKTIRLEIENYRIKYQNSKEGFIRKWPSEYSLDGWLISIKNGGELRPHIHEQGWLSGSIYINVPPKSKIDSGNLVVALGEHNEITDTHPNSKKVINVVTGNMVLFPASLMHYTIPFESDEERIVMAFDVVPKIN